MKFVKLHGLGNDFIFFEGRNGDIELDSTAVERLCDRHFGIGADGVIVVKPPVNDGSAGYMHYINADGTLAQMCGNGVRCIAKYLVDRKAVEVAGEGGSLTVDTLAGPRPIDFTVDENGCMALATVDMGEPILDPAVVPAALAANAVTDSGVPYVREATIESPWGPLCFTAVSMGNPHAVCFLDDLTALPDEAFVQPQERSLETLAVDALGSFFESHSAFPEKANVEFAVVNDDGSLSMRVYERGCGETLACGTGTCATVVAAALTGRSPRENDVHLLGGTLHILWRSDNHVAMTGPATESFSGEVDLA